MQSVAQIAPAFGILSTLNFNTQLAGLGAPSTYLVAFVIALAVAVTLGQLAKWLPSAGGFYTYVSATVGPRSGFIVGWVYSLFVAMIPGTIALYSASIVSAELRHSFGIVVSWPYIGLAIIAVATWVAYRGIRLSGAALMFLSLIEMLILVALAIGGLVSPGPGGFSTAGLNPSSATSSSGFYMAVVFSIFAFTGWEGAAAIAEETRHPRKQIPRAIFGSVTLLGGFYVFCAWGLQVGWGTHALASLAQSTDNAALVLAGRIWGRGSTLVLLAFLNSAVAVCIACAVDSSRNWFAMARAHALPTGLAFVHPTFKTPSRAVLAQALVTWVVGFGLARWVGPDQGFFVMGLAGTLVYVAVYCLGNLGVMRYFRRVRRDRFRILPHFILPLLSTGALLWVAYASLFPLPAPPVRYAPLIGAVLFASGGLALLKLHLDRREEWKTLAVKVFDEADLP
jgi:amino acid transporter